MAHTFNTESGEICELQASPNYIMGFRTVRATQTLFQETNMAAFISSNEDNLNLAFDLRLTPNLENNILDSMCLSMIKHSFFFLPFHQL